MKIYKPSQKRKDLVFQPPIFRGENVSFRDTRSFVRDQLLAFAWKLFSFEDLFPCNKWAVVHQLNLSYVSPNPWDCGGVVNQNGPICVLLPKSSRSWYQWYHTFEILESYMFLPGKFACFFFPKGWIWLCESAKSSSRRRLGWELWDADGNQVPFELLLVKRVTVNGPFLVEIMASWPGLMFAFFIFG